MTDTEDLQQGFVAEFNDTTLLETALTHRSFANEQDDLQIEHNERLEYLGDAVLDLIIGELLFVNFPDMREGELTRLRAALVRTEALAEIAIAIGLGEYLRMGKGEEASGGKDRPTNLCAAFEAVIGAMYLDQGLEAVREFAIPHFEPLLERVLADASDKDARSRLQEWSQAEYGVTPKYQTIDENGPDHAKEFTIEVSIDGQVIATGTGRSKQAGAQAAAQAALDQLDDHSQSTV
ncbi:MAG: ribonuclease III [Phototrophicales bacterium]|nr:MAG: ribonuclease III [Phototrophicales bacterium]